MSKETMLAKFGLTQANLEKKPISAEERIEAIEQAILEMLESEVEENG